MKILYIWDADYPWDIRVEKICQSLVRHGHEIHIAARNLKRRVRYENIGGIHVHRLRTWKNDRINYGLSFPAFFSPVWKIFVEGIVRLYKIDLIIVRDLPLAPLGIRTARKFLIPCIFDMAENYVAMIRDIWNSRKWHGLNFIVRNPHLARFIESYSLAKFDHIITVVEEARCDCVRKGIPREKITIVSNTPYLDFGRGSEPTQLRNVPSIFKGRYSAIYVGGIQIIRGIHTAIKAIPEIIIDVQNFLFVVVGDGLAVKYLRDLATSMHVDKYIHWTGWIEHEDIPKYISGANLGLVPHCRSDHVDTTIPNKLFDFMACGLPVVASDAPPLKRIIEGTGAGVVFKSDDHQDLARAVKTIYYSLADYGLKGLTAVRTRYNWDRDEEKLLSVVKKFS